jgi:hypothetical protein
MSFATRQRHRELGPNRNPSDSDKADRFIAASNPGTDKADNRVPVIVRFKPALLAKIDEAARRRGTSRSGWIQFVLSRAIDAGEG